METLKTNHYTIIDTWREEAKQLEKVLITNGVALPPSLQERPVAIIEDVSPCAKFNDPEISATLAGDLATGLVTCSQVMGISTRILLMYGQFHTAKA